MSSISALSLAELQQENARLLALVGQKEETIKQQKVSIQNLQHQLHLFRTARFGRKTEKGVVPEQLSLQFDDAVPTAEEAAPVVAETTETITYTRNKKGTGRKALPKSLPFIQNIHDLSDAEKQCACGCTLTHIGDEISEQLDVVPQMTFRVVNIRKNTPVKTAAIPSGWLNYPNSPSIKPSHHPGYWQQ